MKKLFFTIIIILTAITTSVAQNEIDALRYSQLYYGGTARSTAIGGAFGALGADFSSLSLNPAGIGLYKISEFTFTPSFYIGRTSSKILDAPQREDYKYNFNMGNIGFVYTFFKRGNYATGNGWKAAQFGFGINRLNNFNNRMIMEGYNTTSSLMNQFVNNANGTKPSNLNDFESRLAYDAYLINPIGDSSSYTSIVNGDVTQRKTVSSNGSINEVVMSLGGNYSDKLYIGATLGFPFIRYFETSTYKEIDRDNKITNFNSFTLYDDLTTTGAGINFKFGMIYRPVDLIRLGIAFHTPTYYYSMQDEYSRRIESDLGVLGKPKASSPQGLYDYELTTPMRVIGSMAFVIGEFGLVSADYEFLDFAEARLRSDNYDFYSENNNIQGKYTSASNIRLGTEWRLDPLTFRAGYGMYGSPFTSGVNDGERRVISFGMGFRDKQFFMDMAYSYSKQTEDYYFYDPTLVKPVKNEMKGHNIMMTIGFKY
jgi:hypothetical protein